MNRVAHIVTLLLFVGACSAPTTETDVDSGPPGDDATHADDAAFDAGRDAADEADTGSDDVGGPDIAPNIPDGACPTLEDEGCFLRDDCAWDGGACASLDQGSPAIEDLTTRTPGVWTAAGHSRLADGDLTAGLTAIHAASKLRGSITVEDTERTWSFPIDGELDAVGGTMTLDVWVPSCFADGDDCTATIRGFRMTGRYDGTQWLFPRPERLQDGLDALFVNLRFQPNDGIKPSTVPDRSPTFVGPLTTVFDGSPLPTEATCDLTFDSADLTAALPAQLDCGDVVVGSVGEPRIIPESFAYVDEAEFWFQIETPRGRLTFVGVDEIEHLAGVFVRDDGTYWDAGSTPIAPEEVEPGDIVGAAVFFAQEAE